MTTNCIKLRKGLFLVEWKFENLQSVGGKTSLLFDHGAVSKAYTLKYRNDMKNSLLEITVLPKNPVKTLKRSYHTAFPSSESSSSEDSINTFSSISDDEATFEINREHDTTSSDSSEDQEIYSNLRDVLEYRSADSDDMDELYEPYSDSDWIIEDTESDDHNEDLHEDVDEENENTDGQIVDEDSKKQMTAQELQLIESISLQSITVCSEDYDPKVLTKTSEVWGPFALRIKDKGLRSRKIPIVRLLFEFESASEIKEGQKEALNRLGSMLDDQLHCDVQFHVMGQKMGAHLSILASGSPVLAAMFQSDCKEKRTGRVKIKDIKPDIFKQMLRFIYTGSTLPAKLSEDDTEELFKAADKYELGLLRKQTLSVMCSRLSIDNVIRYLVIAHLHSAPTLYDACLHFMALHGRTISSRSDWIELVKTYPDLCVIVIQRMLR